MNISCFLRRASRNLMTLTHTHLKNVIEHIVIKLGIDGQLAYWSVEQDCNERIIQICTIPVEREDWLHHLEPFEWKKKTVSWVRNRFCKKKPEWVVFAFFGGTLKT